MKRLTSILAISVIAVMSAGAARADIASTTYVDNKVSPVSTKATNNATEIAALKTGKQDKLGYTAENTANKVVSSSNMQQILDGADADSKYPTVKAALGIAQIAAGAVNDKLGELASKDSVSAASIDANAVTTAKIADLNVTEGKIAANAVTTAKIADSAVTSGKIANGTIVDADISSTAAIATSKISGLDTALAGKLGKNENAVSATKATQDGNGKTIATTYATKTELGTKQNKLVSDGANANISGSNGVTVTVGTDGKIAVSGNQTAIDSAIAEAKSAGTAATTALDAYKTSNDAELGAVKKTADDTANAVNNATTGLAATKKIADDNAAKLKTMATSATVNALTTRVGTAETNITNLQSGKQDKLGYTAENTANKVTALSASSTTTQYPSAKTVYDELAKKQNNLNTDQLAAVNSGITSAKVTTYEGYSAKITAAQNTANTAKTTAEAAIAAPAANTISTDGLYTLTMKVVDGTKTYAWEKIGR